MGSERLFADTNVFLRYLTNDVPEQADAVEHLLVRVMQGEIVLNPNISNRAPSAGFPHYL